MCNGGIAEENGFAVESNALEPMSIISARRALTMVTKGKRADGRSANQHWGVPRRLPAVRN